MLTNLTAQEETGENTESLETPPEEVRDDRDKPANGQEDTCV